MNVLLLKIFVSFIVFLTSIDVTSASNCHVVGTSKAKVEYLIIPMKSDEPKATLTPSELYEINQIASNPSPMNYPPPTRLYRVRTVVNNQPKFWRNPFTLNRQHRYVAYPKEFPRNMKIVVKPIYRKPNPYAPEVPIFVKHPPVEPASNALNDYIPENEGNKHAEDVEIVKSISYELPPELTTYHAHEVASNYLFEEPKKSSLQHDHLKKVPVEIIKSAHQHLRETFGNSIQKNTESQYLTDSQDDESHDSKQPFRIVVPDQEYDEDVKTEQKQSPKETEHDDYDQYRINNRKPITFNTHPRTYLQEEDDAVKQNRPYYQRGEEQDLISADVKVCNETNCETNNKSEETLEQLESNNSKKTSEITPTPPVKGANSDELYSSLDYNEHTEVYVTVTPTVLDEN